MIAYRAWVQLVDSTWIKASFAYEKYERALAVANANIGKFNDVAVRLEEVADDTEVILGDDEGFTSPPQNGWPKEEHSILGTVTTSEHFKDAHILACLIIGKLEELELKIPSKMGAQVCLAINAVRQLEKNLALLRTKG